MKKAGVLAIISAFFITIFASKVYAEYTYYESESISVFQKFNQGVFSISYRWLNLDSLFSYVGSQYLSYGDEYSLENNYFAEFDYIPDTHINILKPVHNLNTFSILSSSAVFQVQYDDIYQNPPSLGYPYLVITFPDASTQTFVLEDSGSNDIYQKMLNLPTGKYQYSYFASNDEYDRDVYSLSGEWVVTTQPYDFRVISPVNFGEVLPYNILFAWDIKTNETDDNLLYQLFLGKTSNKLEMTEVLPGPAANSLKFTITELDHKTSYFWYMIIKNKHGATFETEVYNFKTGGNVAKFYNAPNPFNPAGSQRTKFVFFMEETGTAQVALYSEYGDKIWQSETLNVSGLISAEIEYNGKDLQGKLLYNGSYLAVLTKKHNGRVKTEKCRILIIK